jgi:hypothetical protein
MPEKEVFLTFKPYQLITVSSPEDLAAQDISMYPPVLAKYWGPDAPDRYQRARKLAPYPAASETPQRQSEITG